MKRDDVAIAAYWDACRERHGIADGTSFYVGPFSDPALAPYQGMLLDLVREGKKRATARVEVEFELDEIRRRSPGDYWVVLDTEGAPACLIQITDVHIWRFLDVPLEFAQREGEGDNSLEYWRKVHKDYFVLQCERWGIAWHDNLPVACEGFDLIEMVA